MQLSTSFLTIVAFATLLPCFVQSKSSKLCGDWEVYRDEKCFKILDNNFRTFTEAQEACERETSGNEIATLPVITSAEEQEFLANYLFKTHQHSDGFWIGARYSNDEGRFKWINSKYLDYTNWGAQNQPMNSCVEMKASQGKWFEESCDKRNLVVCQKTPVWSMAQMQQALLAERQERRNSLKAANRQIEKLTRQLRSHTSITDSNVPIGFIYTQLPNTTLPQNLWPGTVWDDISALYAGVFFRVTGSGSGVFGAVQEENTPRITKVEYAHTPDDHPNPDVLPQNGWSDYVYTGSDMGKWYALRFYVSGGEVRPRNMAIRIWKRTA